MKKIFIIVFALFVVHSSFGANTARTNKKIKAKLEKVNNYAKRKFENKRGFYKGTDRISESVL